MIALKRAAPASTCPVCGAELRTASAPCYHQTLHGLRGQDLPPELRGLSSTHVIPYPAQIEVMPSWEEIVTGAFVCGVLALATSGAVEIAYDTWVGWSFDARRSPGRLVAMPVPPASAWLRRAEAQGASPRGRIEQALLQGLEALVSEHAQGYRNKARPWLPLADVIEHARAQLPSAEEVVMHARLVGFEHEDLIEQLETLHPRLVEALVRLAHAEPSDA